MTPGYDRPLYLLPFDHRHSYLSGMFHYSDAPTSAEKAQVIDSKRLIYAGFCAALATKGVPSESAGILVDEEYGSAVLRDAAARGAITAMSVESSGSDEFEFEYGEDFAAHLEDFKPTFAKVLVRYNPAGDAALNARQRERLVRLSAWCRTHDQRLMFELLVPATPEQLASAGSDDATYDRHHRPALMEAAIDELRAAGVDPDIWKIEGLDRREDCERIVAAARRDGREHVSCIVLGRGADDARVVDWLKLAASVDGFAGFAVGRTTFWNAVSAFTEGHSTRAAAIEQIATHFAEWVTIFEQAAGRQPAPEVQPRAK